MTAHAQPFAIGGTAPNLPPARYASNEGELTPAEERCYLAADRAAEAAEIEFRLKFTPEERAWLRTRFETVLVELQDARDCAADLR